MNSAAHEQQRQIFRLALRPDNYVEINAPQWCTIELARKLRAIADYVERDARQAEEERLAGSPETVEP